MNNFLIILFIIIVLAILLAIYYMYLYNKINETIIRVDEAENRIDTNLRDKYDVLNRCVSLFKNKITLEDIKSILNQKGSVSVYEKSHQFFNAGKTSLDDHKELVFITKVGE